MKTTFLLRMGELTLKSEQVRKRMIVQLLRNLRATLKRQNIDFSIDQRWARVFVNTSQPEEMTRVLSNLFGLRSFSRLSRFPCHNHEELLSIASDFFKELVKGKRFAVRARRDKNSPFSSPKIERELGALLFPHSAGVDLTTPEITCFIEVRGKELYLYDEKQKAPGGLPLGTELHALSLISGGFDSPIASWLALRRGIPCDFLFFELGGTPHRAPIYSHIQHLFNHWMFGQRPRLFVIPGHLVLDALHERIPGKYWNIMLKRIFYRVGELISEKHGHAALITGEAVAQVSSQTLSNLRSLESGLSLPILRPLLTFEKEDIISLSREVGTHDTSAKVKEYCAITPKKPATRSTPEQVANLEQDLGGEDYYQSLIDHIEIVYVEDINPQEIHFLETIIDEVPANAVLVDMREDKSQPFPSSSHEVFSTSLASLVDNPTQLSQDRSYLLLCEVGMVSAEVAYMLQELGYTAHSFEGGVEKLQKKWKS